MLEMEHKPWKMYLPEQIDHTRSSRSFQPGSVAPPKCKTREHIGTFNQQVVWH
ncbi:hypothetical protein DPMN_032663 [Dreissena polymorpha]|uniref:Uncharacterized protein n=1 Tax=Dreissena polymorpha TaxID=45954 RepID=A0A9D4M4D1_DREPO|nr:hypothetical protein DPMN_032663 [Dreissena polymorpha]